MQDTTNSADAPSVATLDNQTAQAVATRDKEMPADADAAETDAQTDALQFPAVAALAHPDPAEADTAGAAC